jgi:hypothetical protein
MTETCWGPVCEWIHLLAQWLKVHIIPFAPLFTPIVATVAGLIALYSIHVTRSVARKRAAVDFFLKTDMDKGMVEAYLNFQKASTAFAKHVEKGDPIETFVRDGQGNYTMGYVDVTSYLNIHELVAVGIKNKVFDHDVCYAFWSDALVRHTNRTQKLIDHVVEAEGQPAGFIELRNLSTKWKKKLGHKN